MKNLMENGNSVSILGIIAILGIVVFDTVANTINAAMDNNYNISASVKDRGEINIGPSKSNKEEEAEKKKEKKEESEEKENVIPAD